MSSISRPKYTWKKFVRVTRPALVCTSPKTNIGVKFSSSLVVPHIRTQSVRNLYPTKCNPYRGVDLGYNADGYGWPTKIKARLVGGEDQQKANIAFRELFALSVAVPYVRLLAAMACELGLVMYHPNVEHTFA